MFKAAGGEHPNSHRLGPVAVACPLPLALEAFGTVANESEQSLNWWSPDREETIPRR